MRALAAAACLVLALAAMPSLARAQTWGVGTTPVRATRDEPPAHHHVMREKMLIGGVVMLVVGYAAAVAWSAYYFDSIHLGPLGCNDTYAGWQLLPIFGPVIGMGLGGQCIPDGLHIEEAVLPVLFSVLQLAGTVLTIVGALGHEVRDAPRFSFSVDANGGYASARWSF